MCVRVRGPATLLHLTSAGAEHCACPGRGVVGRRSQPCRGTTQVWHEPHARCKSYPHQQGCAHSVQVYSATSILHDISLSMSRCSNLQRPWTEDVDRLWNAICSGMLPGLVAGFYTFDECHVDLAQLCTFASARLIHAEAVGIDKQVTLQNAGKMPMKVCEARAQCMHMGHAACEHQH